MTLLSDIFQDKTSSGDISDYHVYTGKKAWSQGVEITGVNDPIDPGCLFHFEFPKGPAGTIAPTIADYRKGVLHPSVGVSGGGDIELQNDGRVYSATTFRLSANCYSLPAKTDNYRRFSMWGESGSSISTNTRVRIRLNAQDGSNFWEYFLEWDGTQWKLKLNEQIGGGGNERSSVPLFSSSVGNPCHWLMWIEDHGDTLHYGASVRDEAGPPFNVDSYSETYYAASRNFKSNETGQFGFWSIVNNQILIKGMDISDR